jgi:hypothetical protein
MHWIDPDSLTPIQSKVARFLFNPRGQADGLILASGTEVHFPPHLSRQMLAKLEPGAKVTVYGVKPRSVDMIACVAIETVDGARIDDHGPPARAKKKGHGKKHEHPKDELETRPVEIVDTIERLLHGPKGEVRGVLLESGPIVRFPPHVAHALPELLDVGAKIAIRGSALDLDAGGMVIEASELGSSKRTLRRVPEDAHKHP